MRESEEKMTYSIKIDGSENYSIIEEYAPEVFKNIRRIYDVEDFSIARMFGLEGQQFLDVKISCGKGGAFFIKNTKDPSILIKSISPGEYEVMKNFTANFYTHLLLHPNTLIAPIMGVYTIYLNEGGQIDPISFVLMKSVFDTKIIQKH